MIKALSRWNSESVTVVWWFFVSSASSPTRNGTTESRVRPLGPIRGFSAVRLPPRLIRLHALLAVNWIQVSPDRNLTLQSVVNTHSVSVA